MIAPHSLFLEIALCPLVREGELIDLLALANEWENNWFVIASKEGTIKIAILSASGISK